MAQDAGRTTQDAGQTARHEVPDGATGPIDVAAALGAWLPGRRWFPAKGTDAVFEQVARIPLAGPPEPAPQVFVDVLRALGAGPDGAHVTLQVPLVLETDGPGTDGPADPAGLIAESGSARLYDGAYHPAFVGAWLAAATWSETAPAASAPFDLRGMRVLTGEQSNTSVLLPHVAGGAMLKVLRSLAPGQNPDLVVPLALTRVGWSGVPAPYAWNEITMADAASAGGLDAHGWTAHAGVLAELVPDAEDGFELACDHARNGVPFDDLARDLGERVAQMHQALRTAFADELTPADVTWLLGALRRRVLTATASSTAVSTRAARIEAFLVHLGTVADEAVGQGRPLPPVQRIHGDLHLGQVLHNAGSGWRILDFEGEPLRPLHERTRPDLGERDVAGMLRSFDYASALGGATSPQWARSARRGFLEGYYGQGYDGVDPDGPQDASHPLTDPLLTDRTVVLDAFELDKALYEVVYEERNRPDWITIPLAAVDRILDARLPDDGARQEVRGAPRRLAPPAPQAWNGRAMTDSTLPSAGPLDPLPVSTEDLAAVARGVFHDPHSVLGGHVDPTGTTVTIRTRRPLADEVVIITGTSEHAAVHEQDGIWVAVLPTADATVPDYRIGSRYGDETVIADDPYRFLPTVGELDQYLLGEGRHEELWTALGANLKTYPSTFGEVHGTAFAVWAPNARAVRLVGDVNFWDGASHPMRSLGSTGIWELFVPGVGAGSRYKFEILGSDGAWHQKADPVAKGTEIPPATASVVVQSEHTWNDQEWIAQRAGRDPHNAPLSIYEVHLGSWRQTLSYRDLAVQLTEYVVDMGFTHVELMPVAEHPFGGSWGYQVTSYYAPTSRFGHPDDFRFLVDSLHQAGIGVILDWVPAHFPKDAWALARFDGTALYEHPDPMRGEQMDWGTYVFNFGRSEVRNFLVANATYWLEEFHIDALRVDAVASMLYLDYSREHGAWAPNIHGGRENLEAISFLQEANATAYRRSPGVMMIAEESTAWAGVTQPTSAGGLGFGLKWNMGWMNDTLRYLAEAPINRRYHHHEATFSLVYAYSEQFVLPISHDEVVHGKGSLMRKMPGDDWQQLAGVRLLFAYQWAHPGKQLTFMGNEFAQGTEWAEGSSLDWYLLDHTGHAGVQSLVRDLNALYLAHPEMWSLDHEPAGFEWLDASDADHNVLSFLRRDREGNVMAVLINFSGSPHEGYRLPLPSGGVWREVLNTDAAVYGGSGVGNLGAVQAEEVPWSGRPYSVALQVPPLGAVFLVPEQ